MNVKISTPFKGRVIQVVEALDAGDAVSNQVIALDELFREFGLDSQIAVKWMHSDVASKCKTIESVEVTDKDVLIYHFAGVSEHTLDWTLSHYCTKVLLYHNITPHDFFDEASELYAFCKRGRVQLKDALPEFHFFWADSQYNLDELLELGAAADRAHVIPIIVEAPGASGEVHKVAGSWLFLGRIAANKGQVDLVEAFLDARRRDRSSASKLYLVGRFDPGEPYYERLRTLIEQRGADEQIIITGKVTEEQKRQFLRTSSVMVSFSRHEGFGVPLIEAPLHGTPVVALGGTAVDETMGRTSGVVADHTATMELAMRAAKDPGFSEKLLDEQRKNAVRFERAAVRKLVAKALRQILPAREQFKTVSIVICTYNRRADLERCLDYLVYQTSPGFEVVVVDGPSTDGTKEMLEQYADRVKVVHNPERNLSISRNLGADAAAGDVVAYIDDDAIPFADWVQKVLDDFNGRPLTTAGLGGATYFAGSLKFQVEDVAFNRFAEALPNVDSRQIGKDGWVRSLLGTNTAFSRKHLRSVGGFDEQYDYFLDESDLTFRMQRAGLLVAYDPDLLLRHEFARSENRQTRHTFNWTSICKNTAYFTALYSGLRETALRDRLVERLKKERVEPLEVAAREGLIDARLKDRHVADIWAGMERGLEDSASGPRTRPINATPPPFRAYPIRTDLPRVGIDTKRLHICIVSKEFPPFGASGGIGTLYYHLASELLLLGHEVTVIMPMTKGETRYDQGRFHIRYVEAAKVDFGPQAPAIADNLSWSLNAAAAVAEVHSERFIDVVESALWDTEALAFALIDKPRPPLVVRLVTPFATAAEMNGWTIEQKNADQYVAAEKELIQRADAVVGISKSIVSTIEKRYGVEPDRRWRVDHCGIAYWPFFDWTADYDDLTSEKAIKQFVGRFSKIVLFVGRLEKRKGIDTLLEALSEILSSHRDVGVILAGQDVDGWQAKSTAMLPKKFRDRLLFTGSVTDATREKLMSRAYCLVFPSRYESFGLVPLEAFVHGVPVVAAAAGAIPEVVSDGEAGLLFEAGDKNALAACVTRLVNDPKLREQLADGARARIRQFSGRNAAVRAVEMYVELTSGGQATRPATVGATPRTRTAEPA